MRKNERLSAILDEALELIKRGESIESCLERYPEQAEELRPLLEMALLLAKAGDTGEPPRERLLAARHRFLREAASTAPRKSAPKRSRRPAGALWWPRLFLRPATAMALIIIVAFFTGLGVAWAAYYSLPDSPLYPVKLALEDIRLSLEPDPASRAWLELTLTQKRVQEITLLNSKGRLSRTSADRAASRFKIHLQNALDELAGVDPAYLEPLLQATIETVEGEEYTLADLAERVPSDARPVIEDAVAAARWSKALAMAALADPSVLRREKATPTQTTFFSPLPSPHPTEGHPAPTFTTVPEHPTLTKTPRHPEPTHTPYPALTFTPTSTPMGVTPTPTPTWHHHTPTSTPMWITSTPTPTRYHHTPTPIPTGMVSTPTPTPQPAETPEPTRTPHPSETPEETETPHPTMTPTREH